MHHCSSTESVKGFCATKGGTTHFIQQRVSAVALIPLSIWFVVSIILLVKDPINSIPAFIVSPLNITFAILFLVAFTYHGWLGMKVIIEDYIHCNSLKVAMLMFVYFVNAVTMVAGLVAVFSLHVIFRLVG